MCRIARGNECKVSGRSIYKSIGELTYTCPDLHAAYISELFLPRAGAIVSIKLPIMKKIIFGVLGLALVVGTVGEIPHLAEWGSAEMVGYNAALILGLLGGIYLIYLELQETN